MSYKKELDEMVWSFSRIHAWEQCPFSFYKKYIEQEHGIQNFWAENGSAVHFTLEKIFSGEIDIIEAPAFYIEQYGNICSFTKESVMDNAFNACLDFLCEYDFSYFDQYEILGVEKECRFKVGKYKFKGFIDLLLKDKITGEIIVWDHKSAPYPFKKDGKSVLKNCQDQFIEYKHQIYLYCKQIIDENGIIPSKIIWLHFKDNKTAVIDFDIRDYEETLCWAENTVKKIYRDRKFADKESFMLCERLCDFREECDYKELRRAE